MLSIFLIVSIAIVVIVFYSFASEINKNIISDRQKQLTMIEGTISSRMEEIASIAYNIGKDEAFYLEPVEGARYTGYEMSSTLKRYLVGNSFIEYLAYYRLSEPDKIYTSRGELSFTGFWSGYLGVDKATSDMYIRQIRECKRTEINYIQMPEDSKAFFSYVCPLPQLSENPQAFVLILISASEVAPLIESQLMDVGGILAVFDGEGREIFREGNLTENIAIDPTVNPDGGEKYIRVDGSRYVVQKQVSAANGWTFVSVIRLNDLISGLASRQLLFIVLLLALIFVAVFAMLICIVIQYKPISSLAEAVTDKAAEGETALVDESVLLSSKFAALKDDSEQKQRFENAFHEAEAANKAKSAFLSSMSHDIRTPMNAIIGMSAIAYRYADDPDCVRDCLQKVQVSSRYLLDIINNVLDMSKIESGRFTLSQEAIELPRLIYGLTAILNQSVEAKQQHLLVEIGSLEHEWVVGDNVRLTQVFINILSNSVKFTPEGGTISLRVSQTASADKEYGDYVFVFKDTGIGMSEEFVAQVFETFSRDGGANKVEGTGLGMAIAKNLVELMGGTISCESELGKGTTFTVKLHMKLAEQPEVACGAGSIGERYKNLPAQPDWSTEDFSGCHVLLAEDNNLNRELARMIIGETGAELTEAVNGQAAVEAFQSRPEGYFGVILMDLQMPVMNGYEAAAAIRALPRSDAATVTIYALTASTFDEDVRQVREAGMNGHIGKPYLPEELLSALRQAFRKKE